MRMNNCINWNTGGLLPTFNHTITLYNRYYDPLNKTTTWHRTVVDNCYYGVRREVDMARTTLSQSNSYVCRIAKDERYMAYSEWCDLPESKKAFRFTISPGDLIFDGVIKDFIDETIKDCRANDLLEKYKPNCFVIKTFSDNTGLMNVAEHYHITGV